jgi:zinc transport system ATP-binding protein
MRWGALEYLSMAALVEISGVDFSYGPRRLSGPASSRVLQQINLQIDSGSTLGLIGPNGGGKTTLIRLLLGLLEPTAGTIRIAGIPPAAAIRRGDLIGYLPQGARGEPHFPLSVRQAVRLGLAGKTGMLRGYAREDVDFTEELLSRVGLSAVADRPIGSLSGGQLQRAYIARALAPRPRLLLLDEPTTGIDQAGQQRFIDFLQGLKSDLGLTVVFVSHDLRAVSAISDRIACLNGGLHYHDVPDHLPATLVYEMFACDLEAMGIKGGRVCTHGASQGSGFRIQGSGVEATDVAVAAESSASPAPVPAGRGRPVISRRNPEP